MRAAYRRAQCVNGEAVLMILLNRAWRVITSEAAAIVGLACAGRQLACLNIRCRGGGIQPATVNVLRGGGGGVIPGKRARLSFPPPAGPGKRRAPRAAPHCRLA